MKRTTAAKHIKTHLNDYRKRLGENKRAYLRVYIARTSDIDICPLCVVDREACEKAKTPCCKFCLRWPGGRRCGFFREKVNNLKTVRAKLRLIDKLEAELDRWAAEEATP